jgi:hypothetical protein
LWRGKWENGLKAKMGYSGDSGGRGGGAFLAKILVFKWAEGQFSETG